MNDILIIMPEIVLLTMTCITLIADLYISSESRWTTYALGQASLVLTWLACWVFPHGQDVLAFQGQFSADLLAFGLKNVILGLMVLVLVYSRHYVLERPIPFGEFTLLALFSTLGMMFLVSAKSLLMLYLGLELMSLSLYAIVALEKTGSLSVEASMKYFVMGALASGLLLYGMSLLFGVTGTIQLDQIAFILQAAGPSMMNVILFAMIFCVAAVAFKLGAVPFHMWIPDVYQGAPTSMTLLVSTAPKLAAFGLAYRIFHDTLAWTQFAWMPFFVLLAVLSLAIGNIVAISQTNVKRLLGYSTIGHIGFLFLGLLVAPVLGYGAALFYMVVYTIVVACAFGVLIYLSKRGIEVETFDDLKGLSQRDPWMAFVMLLVAFSLAGVPPTVGFYAKFMILMGLVNVGLAWLAAFAVVFSIIGAYYYLKIIKAMYFDVPEKLSHIPATDVVAGPTDVRYVLSLNGLAILGLGILPGPLYVACQAVFQTMVP